mmetsp:Transcript_30429/g.87241  ORF Transcript_30429/g.87241 Transcript_30429/m.87241 type:complete len:838 (+) Transcript_30429:160-2673(+)
MVISLGVAAAAGVVGAYNWAANLYSYNRDAWMTDIQVEQEHTYQEDNLKIAMYEMDREEVRDLMQNCINKINNVILVTTLILSLAGEMLFEGQIPADCPPFVLNAYMLCLGSAIFHLVLSILFGLFASSEAYEKSTEFLTRRIKPEWKENFNKMRRRKRCELTQAFEDKPLSTMLKPPLARRCHRLMRQALSSDSRPSRAKMTSAAAGGRGNSPPAHGEPSYASEQPGNFECITSQSDLEAGAEDALPQAAEPAQRRHRHPDMRQSAWKHEYWEEAEKEWIHFTTCMFKCVCFGTKNLLEACSYLCIATLYGKYQNAWVFWATQMIFTSLNVLMMDFFISREKERNFPNMAPWFKNCLSQPWAPPHLVALIPATGPILVAAAATVPIEACDRFLIPIGYFSHVVVICVFFSYLCHASVNMMLDENDNEGDSDEDEELSAAAPSLLSQKAPEAVYQPMPVVEEGQGPATSSQGPRRPRPQPMELDLDSECKQETDRTKLSARSTVASLCCSEELGNEPKTPRTRARGLFVKNALTLFPRHVHALPDFMLCRGLFILMLLWISALIWALHNAYTRDFRDRQSWPEWMSILVPDPVKTLEVEHFAFRRPSPYFSPHAVTCPIDGKFFMADSFRVFMLHEGGGDEPSKPRPFPCDVNGTIADIAAVCDSENACWPVVLLETKPPKVFDCKKNETWPLLQVSMSATRVATMGASGSDQGLDVLFASGDQQVIQYRRSEHRHGFAPEWVVLDHSEDILALDVVDDRLVVFLGHSVEYQELATGKLCGHWKIPSGQKVIGGGCARGNTIHILATEGHTIHILKSQLPEVEECKGPKAIPNQIHA